MPLLHLLGVPVSRDDAGWLAAELRDQGEPLAETIEKAVERGLYALALAPDERDVILSVLVDCPDGLAELRGRLARDHHDRVR